MITVQYLSMFCAEVIVSIFQEVRVAQINNQRLAGQESMHKMVIGVLVLVYFSMQQSGQARKGFPKVCSLTN